MLRTTAVALAFLPALSKTHDCNRSNTSVGSRGCSGRLNLLVAMSIKASDAWTMGGPKNSSEDDEREWRSEFAGSQSASLTSLLEVRMASSSTVRPAASLDPRFAPLKASCTARSS
jgi:hypothetical protein